MGLKDAFLSLNEFHAIKHNPNFRFKNDLSEADLTQIDSSISYSDRRRHSLSIIVGTVIINYPFKG